MGPKTERLRKAAVTNLLEKRKCVHLVLCYSESDGGGSLSLCLHKLKGVMQKRCEGLH
jgi:hypothetical protein